MTVSIFFRDLQDIWKKADLTPTDLVVLAAKNLGILKRSVAGEEALAQLKSFWSENQITGKSFSNFETALFRLGRGCRRKKRCNVCLASSVCSAH